MISRKLALPILLLALTAASMVAFTDRMPLPDGSIAQAQDSNAPPATYGIFYEYEVLHQLEADETDTLEYVSINDQGKVAFSHHRRQEADVLLTTDGTAEAVEIDTSFPLGSFAGLQINNLDEIVAVDNDKRLGGTDFWRVLRFNLGGVGREIIATSTADQAVSVDFNNIFDRPSINNAGEIAFTATGGRDNDSICGANARCLVVPNPGGTNPFLEDSLNVSNIPEPRIADTGQVLAWVQPGNNEQEIRLYGVAGGDYELIADSNDFAELGQRPAVSDDGEIVVFYGDLEAGSSILLGDCLGSLQPDQCPDYGGTTGPGIFASIKQDDGTRRLVRLTGRGTTPTTPTNPDIAELGWADNAPGNFSMIQFDPNGYDPAQPLGVTNMVDNSFVVSFIAQPTQASRDNPALEGEPLTFSGRRGLWALRVDAVPPVGSDESAHADDILYHPASPLPVVQEGDRIRTEQGSVQVLSIEVEDPLTAVEDGRPGEHLLAFSVQTFSNSSIVVRASHLDFDQDGLLDHWEAAGKGIDIDRDGTPELDLAAMGATPDQRDLFLEVDWLAPQDTPNGVRDFSPHPEALLFVHELFRNAPDPITLHIDGGPGRSLAMGSDPALLQGGDLIQPYLGAPGADAPHLDGVFLDGNQGAFEQNGRWYRSLDDIKQNNFGTTDKFARAFAFHYAVFADKVVDPFTLAEDASLVVGESSYYFRAADALVDLPPQHQQHRVPGNDILIGLRGVQTLDQQALADQPGSAPPGYFILPPGFVQGRALAHGLGLNLGLREGGTDRQSSPWLLTRSADPAAYKPSYVSLMNHAYTFGLTALADRVEPGQVSAEVFFAGTPFSGTVGVASLVAQPVLANLNLSTRQAAAPTTIDGNSASSLLAQNTTDDAWAAGDPFIVLPPGFSRSNDPVFRDWPNIQLDFAAYAPHLGNAFGDGRLGMLDEAGLQAAGLAQDTNLAPTFTFDDLAATLGPFDEYLPTASFAGPAPDASFGVGSTFDVQVAATDDTGIGSVVVSFDRDGNGTLAASETLSATLGTSPTFHARLADIGGPTGTRIISATVRDLAGRIDVITQTVSITSEPPTTPTSAPGNPNQESRTLYLPLVTRAGQPGASPPTTATPTPTSVPNPPNNPDNPNQESRTLYLPLVAGSGQASAPPPTAPTAPTAPTVEPTTPVPGGPPPEPIGRGFSNPVAAVYGLGEITALAFAPDGETALVGGSTGQAALLDPLSGEIIQRYGGHTAAVNGVAFAPDGETIVTGSTDTTVRLWDTATGDMLRRFVGHSGAVYAVAFAPDGSQILSGGTTGSGTRTDYVRLWDTATGATIRTFEGHSGAVYAVAFAPDGSQILTGSGDDLAKLWNVATGEEIRTLSGQSAPVRSVAFAPDGTQALTGGGTTARLWDLRTGGARTIDAHGYSVAAVAFAPDGTRLLTGGSENGSDGTVKLWDTDGNLLHTFEGHTQRVLAVAFAPDGERALSGGSDGSIRLWDARVPTVQSIAHPDDTAVNAVAWTPDGTQLLTGDAAGVARLWDSATGNLVRGFSGHTSDIAAVALSPDGDYALTGSNGDTTARIWDVNTGAEVAALEHPVSSFVYDAVFSAAGDQVFTGSQGGNAYLWDWDSDTLSATLVHTLDHETNTRIAGVAISPDGSQLATATYQAVTLWDAATGAQVRTFTSGRSPNFTAVAFAPDGAWLAASEQSNTVYMWQIDTSARRDFSTLPEGTAQRLASVDFSPDGTRLLADGLRQTFIWAVDSGDLVNVLDTHADDVNEAAFAPDGSHLATASDDGTARIWDALAGSMLHTTPSGHADGVQDVAYFSDGSALVSAGFDGTLKLWDTATGTVSRTLRVPRPGALNNSVLAVDVSVDGRFIASGSQYNLALWDAQSGLLLRTFATDTNDNIYGVALSPDGALLAAGGTANTLYLFDTATGDELRRFTQHSNRINDVAFAPDGSRLLSGSTDGTALLWDVNDANVTLGSFTRNGEAINAVAFAPNGEQVAAGDTLGAIVWDISTGQEVARLEDAAFSVSNVAALDFSPDSSQLLTARSTVAELWDIESSTLLRAFTGHTSENVGNPAIINAVAFAPDGTQIATGGAQGNNSVQLWEVAVRPALRSFTDPDDTGYTSVAVAPDGQTAATGNCDATVYLWNATTGAQVRSITGFPGLTGPGGGGPCVNHLDISADGSMLLGGTSTTVRLHDAGTGDILQAFAPHRYGVFTARFTPDGSQVLTVGGDRNIAGCLEECGSVKLWDATSGDLLATFTHDPHVSAAALSPDGRYLATAGGADGLAWLWDVNDTSAPILTLEGSTDVIDSIAFAPDSSRIAAGSRDGTALLWDRATGGFLFSFNHGTYSQRVRHVAFATAQPWLVITSEQTSYVWDSNTGELRFAVSGGGLMRDADFTPDDSALLTGNTNGTATLWQTAAE
jgi:WD40 repeat protein